MSKFLEFFKENKEIIILIPTLLGGLYQLLNILILVGLPYIRYFSVSQVIPDGLLISIVLFWIYVAIKVIQGFYKQINGESESTDTNKQTTTKKSLLFHITYIIIMCSTGILGFYFMYIEDDFSSFSTILLRYVAYAISAMLMWAGIKYFLVITGIAKIILSKIKSVKIENKKFIANITIILIISILIRVIPNEISIINQMFIKVNNFENYSSFSKEIQNIFEMKSEPILLYINKDYAFFRIPGKEEKILVVDAKRLTEIRNSPLQDLESRK
jgi:hypothetical protein